MRKTSFLITTAALATLLAAPMAQAQILGGSGGGGLTGNLGGTLGSGLGGASGNLGGAFGGAGQLTGPDASGLGSRVRGTTDTVRGKAGDTATRARGAADRKVRSVHAPNLDASGSGQGSGSATAGGLTGMASGAFGGAGQVGMPDVSAPDLSGVRDQASSATGRARDAVGSARDAASSSSLTGDGAAAATGAISRDGVSGSANGSGSGSAKTRKGSVNPTGALGVSGSATKSGANASANGAGSASVRRD